MHNTDHLNPPYGGKLVSRIVDAERRQELRSASKNWLSWDLTPRQLCDLELLITGSFSPLESFLGRADYESVCSSMRLANGLLWPIPVVLDLPADLARQLKPDAPLALRDTEGVMLAVLHVRELWEPDRKCEAESVFGTSDPSHPGAAYSMQRANPVYVSGLIEGLQSPSHYDYRPFRLSPAETRADFSALGWRRVVGVHPQNPMHRAEVELTFRAAKNASANLFIHPSVGLDKLGDIDHYTRVRCYRAILPHYPANTARLALLPLAARMAGPREALWHAIIRRNFGCTHFMVGADHASAGNDSQGKPFYAPGSAQKLAQQFQPETGVEMVPYKTAVYQEDKGRYVPEDEVPQDRRALKISESELRARLAEGRDIPGWFTFPHVTQELRRAFPTRYKQGFTIFFTGLSGAGKSTIANVLMVKFLELGGRPVTLLDGDIVRKNLSSELSFSKEHRDLNIRRIGFVAREITKNGGIAICAPIAPYDNIRKEVRRSIESIGGFVLVYASTSLEVCEQRDRKGLYAKARAGIIPGFTGISDPYEVPLDAEIVLNTADMTPQEAAQEIMLYLEKQGYVGEAAESYSETQ